MRRENDWEWVQIKVRPKDKETIEELYGWGSLETRAQWMVQELAQRIRSGTVENDDVN